MNCNEIDIDIEKIYFEAGSSFEMVLEIDNPTKQLKCSGQSKTALPGDVTAWDGTGTEPSGHWVLNTNHWLIVEYTCSSVTNGPNPIEVTKTKYYSVGQRLAWLDIIFVEKKSDGTKKTKRIRKQVVIVSSGGG